MHFCNLFRIFSPFKQFNFDMDTRYKKEQKVLYNGEQHVIKTCKKNFITKEISYRLYAEDGMNAGVEVQENELKPATKDKPKSDPLIALRENYKKVIGKNVPTSMKNNSEWMEKKIAEVTETEDETPYQVLKKLDFDQLTQLCEAKELDIQISEFLTTEDLLVEVCEKLGVVCEK